MLARPYPIAITLALLLAFAGDAFARTLSWQDPDIDQVIAASSLIIEAEALPVEFAEGTRPREREAKLEAALFDVQVRVIRLYRGDLPLNADGDPTRDLRVVNHNYARWPADDVQQAALVPGQRYILFLQPCNPAWAMHTWPAALGKGGDELKRLCRGAWMVPTPSTGVWPVDREANTVRAGFFETTYAWQQPAIPRSLAETCLQALINRADGLPIPSQRLLMPRATLERANAGAIPDDDVYNALLRASLAVLLRGGLDSRDIATLPTLLEREDAMVREAACDAVCKALREGAADGGPVQDAMRARLRDRLFARLSDPSSAVQAAAARALLEFPRKETVAALILSVRRALDLRAAEPVPVGPFARVRESGRAAMVRTLTAFRAVEASRALIAIVKKGGMLLDTVRAMAEFFVLMPDGEADSAMVGALISESGDFVTALGMFLMRRGTAASAACGGTDALCKLVASRESGELDRQSAIWALGGLGDPVATTTLCVAISSAGTTPNRMLLIAHALGRIGDPAALASLRVNREAYEDGIAYALIYAHTFIADTTSVAVLEDLIRTRPQYALEASLGVRWIELLNERDSGAGRDPGALLNDPDALRLLDPTDGLIEFLKEDHRCEGFSFRRFQLQALRELETRALGKTHEQRTELASRLRELYGTRFPEAVDDPDYAGGAAQTVLTTPLALQFLHTIRELGGALYAAEDRAVREEWLPVDDYRLLRW